MSLYAHVRFNDRDVDIDLSLGTGSTLALVGPNGAGKSTVADAVAGLARPDAGRIAIDDRVVYSSDSEPRFVAPHRRRVALLGQSTRLFPHLSVRSNVAFAPRSAGVDRRRALARADQWLDAVGATDLTERRPRELSGGQAQRVALARALAAEPRLLVLDEPLSALDVATRARMRSVLRDVLADRTCVLITHDAADLVALADETAVLERGRIVERATATDILSRPATPFAARLAGLNLLPDGDGAWVFGPDAVALRPALEPEDAFDGTDSHSSALRAVVSEVTVAGGRLRVTSDIPGTAAVIAELPLDAVGTVRPGDPVLLRHDRARSHRVLAPNIR